MTCTRRASDAPPSPSVIPPTEPIGAYVGSDRSFADIATDDHHARPNRNSPAPSLRRPRPAARVRSRPFQSPPVVRQATLGEVPPITPLGPVHPTCRSSRWLWHALCPRCAVHLLANWKPTSRTAGSRPCPLPSSKHPHPQRHSMGRPPSRLEGGVEFRLEGGAARGAASAEGGGDSSSGAEATVVVRFTLPFETPRTLGVEKLQSLQNGWRRRLGWPRMQCSLWTWWGPAAPAGPPPLRATTIAIPTSTPTTPHTHQQPSSKTTSRHKKKSEEKKQKAGWEWGWGLVEKEKKRGEGRG